MSMISSVALTDYSHSMVTGHELNLWIDLVLGLGHARTSASVAATQGDHPLKEVAHHDKTMLSDKILIP
jgi:hypothetical protein